MTVDKVRLQRTLGNPELAWLVDRIRRRLQHGRDIRTNVTLSNATAAQRAAAARLLGRQLRSGASLSVPLDRVERSLRAAGIAPDLRSAVEALAGPISNTKAQRESEEATRTWLTAQLASCRHVGSQWYDAWSCELTADGSLTRLIRRGDTVIISDAVAVLDRLPAQNLPVPVLAEATTGDTKALSGTPLERLVLRALAYRTGKNAPCNRAQNRDIWNSAGVVMDDMASQVLVLGVKARQSHLVGNWLDSASKAGLPFRLTLQQLLAYPVSPVGPRLYVCENPAVLRVAAVELGADCPPLICTEGQPSAACHRLLTVTSDGDISVWWRGDFDWTGVSTTTKAISAYGASPWRMTAADYETALSQGDSEPLIGSPAPTGWDPALHQAMRARGAAVMEERLIPRLLQDLEHAAPKTPVMGNVPDNATRPKSTPICSN